MALTIKKKNYPENLDSFIEQKPIPNEKLRAVTVKFPVSFHSEIKIYAMKRGMTLKDLFLDMYAFYKENK